MYTVYHPTKCRVKLIQILKERLHVSVQVYYLHSEQNVSFKNLLLLGELLCVRFIGL